jgi:hypothetical protein
MIISHKKKSQIRLSSLWQRSQLLGKYLGVYAVRSSDGFVKFASPN